MRSYTADFSIQHVGQSLSLLGGVTMQKVCAGCSRPAEAGAISDSVGKPRTRQAETLGGGQNGSVW